MLGCLWTFPSSEFLLCVGTSFLFQLPNTPILVLGNTLMQSSSQSHLPPAQLNPILSHTGGIRDVMFDFELTLTRWLQLSGPIKCLQMTLLLWGA